MKIICSKADLLKCVNIVLKAVPSRTTMPILECILIEAYRDEVKFTTNDMELGIETRIEAKVIEKGTIALDARIFSDIVRKLPDNDVTIVVEDNFNVTITCEKSKFNIVGKNGEDFSYIPVIEKEDCVIISQFALKELINQTIFSLATNENNKIMTGELFDVKDNILKVVSLDGSRVSIRKIELKEKCEDKRVIVPGKTLSEISKILSGEIESMVSIYFSNNYILFEFDNTIVVSRLIEGEYYRVEQMLSNDYETKISVNKREFLNCIDRATLLVNEGDKRPVVIDVLETYMELKINSQKGSMDENINIEKEGKDIQIGFNPKFLIDALKVIDDEIINVYFVNSKNPCFIKNDEGSYVYYIMPVNFSGAR